MTLDDQLFEIAKYTIPSIITGAVAFGMMHKFYRNEENKRKFELLRENQKQSLPLRLQAYERMVLFLERINPINIVMRIEPNDMNAPSYATLLIHNINTEYEHNLSQQIYLTNESWEAILKAKNGIISQLRSFSTEENILKATEMRTKLLEDFTRQESLSNVAISYIKEELKRVF